MYQVACGPDGTVWAVDTNGHRIHHFSQSGELLKTIGEGISGTEPGELNLPGGIAVSRKAGGSIFVGQFHHLAPRISEFNQIDGDYRRTIACSGTFPGEDSITAVGAISDPRGMCLSPDEAMLAVACHTEHCVKLISLVEGQQNCRDVVVTIGREGRGDESDVDDDRIRGEGQHNNVQFNRPMDVRFTPD